ncbi:MAG TPA: choice-of-anchor D domain-containing protein [Usitatibacter sp.]|nr:choice-of-anchor D domain-containing protein [Usitatibacter sp.]
MTSPFAKLRFSPSTIVVGDTSTLTVELNGGGGVTSATLDLTYAAGVTNVAGTLTNDCGAAVTTPSGGLSLAGITLPLDGTCSVSLPVTGIPGLHYTTLEIGAFGDAVNRNINPASAYLGVSTVPFVVTNTSGSRTDSGSLPNVIDAVNSTCTLDTPPTITFALPPGPLLIQPTEQMTLTCPNTTLDGTSAGAAVTLDGAACATCSGIVVGADDVGIRGLTISKFAAAGVYVSASRVSLALNDISGNGVGIDVAGGLAFIGNSEEGNNIFGNAGEGIFVRANAEIIGNNILDNGGIGLSVRGGGALIGQNLVSGNSDGVAFATAITCDCALRPADIIKLRARASAKRAKVFFSGASQVDSNVIAGNSGRGVVIYDSREVIIGPNSIFANGGIGIDVDGDGPTAQGSSLQDYPVIASVAHVGSDTVIAGTLGSPYSFGTVNLYTTNDPRALPEGEEHLIAVSPIFDPGIGKYRFDATITGRLVDNVTAMAMMGFCGDGGCAASEFSPKFAVASPPALTLSTTTLDFGTVLLGATSAPRSLTLSNGSSTVITFSAPFTSSGDFFIASNDCGTTLDKGASCTVVFVFTPKSAGPGSFPFTIASDATGSPHTVTLTGQGALASSPVLTVAPAALVFPATVVGTPSTPLTFTITNSGSVNVDVASAVVSSGPFAAAGGCVGTLAPDASCTVTLKFVPTVVGPASGTFTVTSNALGSPHQVTLSGSGLAAPAPGAGVSPPSLTFAARTVATTSPPQSVTLTNDGTANMAIGGITISGDFAFTSACPKSLAPGAGCVIDVTFTPLITGTRTGSLSISTNAPGSPHLVALNGVGVSTAVGTLDASPSSLDFGAQTLNHASVPQLVFVSNVGSAPVDISAAAPSGDFALADLPAGTLACGGSLAVGATCFVNVTFVPSTLGNRAGVLHIASNGTNPSVDVALSGVGVAAVPQRALNVVDALAFGAQPFGTRSAGQAVVLANVSGQPVVVSDIDATGDFSVSESCTAIPAGGSCTATVFFTPSARGSRGGALTIRIASETAPYVVTLSGEGTANPVPILRVSPTRVGFGNAFVGTISAPAVVTLSNVGEARLLLDGLSAPGDFDMESHCGSFIDAGTSCVVDVRFFARMLGARGGLLEIRSNAAGSPHFVDLSGTGCAIPNVGRSRIPQLLCGP